MFAKSKIIRLSLWACVAAVGLPLGNELLQPTQANAAEIVRVGPIVRVAPVAPVAPVVRVAPVVPVAPVVRVGPVYPHYYWNGFRWYR